MQIARKAVIGRVCPVQSKAAVSHLLVKVTEVMLVGVASAARVVVGAAGVRRPLHLCHLQPVSEVDHPAAFKLMTTHTNTHL